VLERAYRGVVRLDVKIAVKIVVRLSVGTHAQCPPGLRTTIFTTGPGAG